MAAYYLEQELFDLFKKRDDLKRFVTDEVLDGVWYWDLENPDHEYLSPAFWHSLGYDPRDKEHSPKAWQGLIHPKDAELALSLVEKHLAQPERPYEQILRYQHAEGHQVSIFCKGKAIFKEGKPVRMMGFHLDITEEVGRSHDLQQVLDLNRDLLLITNNNADISVASSGWIDFVPEGASVPESRNLFDFLEDYFDLSISKAVRGLKNGEDFQADKAAWEGKGESVFFRLKVLKKSGRYFFTAHDISAMLIQQRELELGSAIVQQLSNLHKQHLINDFDLGLEEWRKVLDLFSGLLDFDSLYYLRFDDFPPILPVFDRSFKFKSGQLSDLVAGLEYDANYFRSLVRGSSKPTHVLNVNSPMLPKGMKSYFKEQHYEQLACHPIYCDNKLLSAFVLNWKGTFDYSERSKLFEIFSSFLNQFASQKYLSREQERQTQISQRVIEEAKTPIFINDVFEKRHHFVNDAFCQLLGYSRDEILAMSYPFDYWPSDQLAKIENSYAEALDRENAQFELLFKHAEGHLIPLRLKSNLIKSPGDKEPYAVFATLEDFRYEQRLEKALLSERNFSQKILELSPMVFMSFDRQLKMVNLHDAAYSFLKGISSIKDLEDYLRLTGESVSLNQLINTFRESSEERLNFTTKVINDNDLYFDWSVTKSTKDEGIALMFFGFDISERVKLEKELYNKEKSLEEAGQLAKLGSLEIDHINKTYRHSQSAAQLFKVPAEEPFMLRLLERMPANERERLLKTWQQHLATKKNYKIQHQVVVGGETRYVERVVRTEFDALTGQALFTRGTIQDITERVNYERRLESAQRELKKKNRLFATLNMVTDLLKEKARDSDALIYQIFQKVSKVLEIEKLTFYKVVSSEGHLTALHQFGFRNGRESDLPEAAKDDLSSFIFQPKREGLSLKESHGPIFKEFFEEDNPIHASFEVAGADSLYYYPLLIDNEVSSFWVIFENSAQPFIDPEINDLLNKLNTDLNRSNQLLHTSREHESTLKFLNRSQEIARIGHYVLNLENRADFKPSEVLMEILEMKSWEVQDMEAWFARIHPYDRSEVAAKHLQALENEKAYRMTYRFRKNDGVYIWLDVTAAFENTDSGKRFIGTVQDISTERKYLERLDRQNQRLRKISWTQSHMLRAPLARLQGLLAETEEEGRLSEKDRIILESVEELDAIVRDIVEGAGDEMMLKEQANYETVDFFLPYDSIQSLEVLVVDDDPIIRMLHARLFKKAYDIDSELIIDGKALIDYIIRTEDKDPNLSKLHLVLLDLNMPDTNGWDVLEFLKDHPCNGQFVVVVISSSTDEKDKERALAFKRVIDYVEKPLSMEKMKAFLNHKSIRAALEKLGVLRSPIDHD